MWHLIFNQKFEALEIGANDTEFPRESFQKIWTWMYLFHVHTSEHGIPFLNHQNETRDNIM